MRKILLLYLILSFMPVQAEDTAFVDKKRFLNLSVIGPISLNGYDQFETSNNLSIGLIHTGAKNVSGFALATFNYVDSIMEGLELGAFNYGRNLSGVQLGGFNTASNVNGLQLGGMNRTEILSGLQIGIGNEADEIRGLQIGLINISKDNDYPIGLINIVKDGDMNAGVYTDEMSNVIATFRSGGRYHRHRS